jgi:hypothetical protein
MMKEVEMRSPLFAAVILAAATTVASSVLAKGRTPAPARDVPVHVTDAAEAPLVQVALLLDTSNSMDGLIDQARGQLWKVVNQLARARRGGYGARFEVALYEYGNNRLSARDGYVRQVLPFTTDLDRVSEALFALTTNGGEEYCGTVIRTALDDLRWSPSARDLKVVFIAGNEPFSQGPVDFRAATRRAHERGIVVNTIHCGTAQAGVATGWSEGARIASGAFSAIDQNRVVEFTDAPQDDEIARLSQELNKTYVPYGAAGASGFSRQEAQDQNAMKAGKGSVNSRAVTKAGRLYANSTWDLVDAVLQREVDLKKLKAEELPEAMRALTPEQRQSYVEARSQERQKLQAQIAALNTARERHLATLPAKKPTDDSLDAVMAKTLRAQAARKGLVVE